MCHKTYKMGTKNKEFRAEKLAKLFSRKKLEGRELLHTVYR
jgi:hypothetical protein